MIALDELDSFMAAVNVYWLCMGQAVGPVGMTY